MRPDFRGSGGSVHSVGFVGSAGSADSVDSADFVGSGDFAGSAGSGDFAGSAGMLGVRRRTLVRAAAVVTGTAVSRVELTVERWGARRAPVWVLRR